MRRSRLPLAPSLAAGVAAALVLAGCSADAAPTEETDEPTTSVPASVSAAVEAACEDTTPADDAVVPGVGVTDEFGTYCTVVFDPASSAAFDPNLADEAYLTSQGFTMEDAEAAYTAAIEYVVSVGMDSTRLDNYTLTEDEWFDEHRSLFFDNGSGYDITSGLVDTGVTFTNYSPEPIVRDGNPRLSSMYLEQSGITAFTNDADGSNILGINIVVTATYRGTDAGIAAAYLDRNPDSSTETLQQASPQLFDGVDTGFTLTGAYLVNYRADTFDVVSGTQYSFDLTVDGEPLP